MWAQPPEYKEGKSILIPWCSNESGYRLRKRVWLLSENPVFKPGTKTDWFYPLPLAITHKNTMPKLSFYHLPSNSWSIFQTAYLNKARPVEEVLALGGCFAYKYLGVSHSAQLPTQKTAIKMCQWVGGDGQLRTVTVSLFTLDPSPP